MISNVHFNNIFANDTVELYLYQRLRWYAKDRGGIISGFEFSKTEKYDVLPKLAKNGWVEGDKITKHRNLLVKYNCSNISVRMSEYDLLSLENFKAFLIASCEAYVVGSTEKKDRKNLNKNSVECWAKKKGEDLGLHKKNENAKNGEVLNSNLSKLMGISKSSVTRWRRLSNTLSFNEYELVAKTVSEVSKLDRTITMLRDNNKGYASVREKVLVKYINASNLPEKRGSFVSKRYGGLTTYSMQVSSSIEIFVNCKRKFKNGGSFKFV